MTAGRAITAFAYAAVGLYFLPSLAAAPAESAGVLQRRIENLVVGKPGAYSLAFRDFETGETVHLRADNRTHAASLMKLPVMMAAFELAGRGELDLDSAVAVHEEFRSIVGGKPFLVPIEPASPLRARKGRKVTLRELIKAMITRSDNTATNLVIERIGAECVNDLVRRLGTRNTKILRGVDDDRAYEAGMNNETSAADMLSLLEACRESRLFTRAAREEMMATLRGQRHRSMIAQGIPEQSRAAIANKTGSISWVEHDAGVVELAGGRSYGIVILTHGFADKRDEAIRTGAAISRLIFDYASGR